MMIAFTSINFVNISSTTKSIQACLEELNHVEAPRDKGSCDMYRLELLSEHMYLSSIILTTLASAFYMIYISVYI